MRQEMQNQIHHISFLLFITRIFCISKLVLAVSLQPCVLGSRVDVLHIGFSATELIVGSVVQQEEYALLLRLFPLSNLQGKVPSSSMSIQEVNTVIHLYMSILFNDYTI